MITYFPLILIFIVGAKADLEDTYDNNGWRPITNDKVLAGIYNNLIKTQDAVPLTADWSPVAEQNIEEKIDMQAYNFNRKLMNEHYYDNIGMDDKQDEKPLTEHFQKINQYKNYNEHSGVDKPVTIRLRTAKKILGSDRNINMFKTYQNKADEVKRNKKEQVKIREVNLKNAEYDNSYEVTEAPENPESSDAKNNINQSINNNSRFFKSFPKYAMDKNLSNLLFSILGNYNIRVNDNLTNYALSRNKYYDNTPKISHTYPAPVRMPPMRNSQNYFPLDPLLAVFLSNYGYYLPGFYGFPSNYYNVYGYLASNNIHNNKPFGAYKIYSDTDSSHK